MPKRFNRDIAKRDFDCYDCRLSYEKGRPLIWDNMRDCRICEKCLQKLEILLEQEADKIALEGKRPRWNPSMKGVKPWEMNDFDVNNYPLPILREYIEIQKYPPQKNGRSGEGQFQ